ncbi:hypothetical protein QJQ45_025000 [Haematococcus lacustris]|nr:hypothetical protein QJQ45_025000 [Haematococcus lacustris]
MAKKKRNGIAETLSRVENLADMPASEPAAPEPGPSTPPPAKRSKRIEAEQAAEPTQPTEGKGKGQGKAATAKPAPQPGRWLDRDCNAALNMQRIGESRWRPLELCYWPVQGALPAKGKKYPGLDYKRLRDKPPKAQQHQQPAEAHNMSDAEAVVSAEEELYDGLSFVSHMIAGAVAGTVEHVAMYPVDTIKTRMQALSHPGQRLHNMSVWGAIHTAVRREGLAALYKGVGAVAGGAGPAHAVHFAVYEAVKQQLGGYRPGHNPLISGVAGAVATAFNDAIMTPADVIKQRLQVVHSPYRGVLDCVRQVYHSEGPAAFFRSYRTTLVMNVPFIAMHFSVYDAAKGLLVGGEDGDEDTLLVQLVAGGVAGGSAAGGSGVTAVRMGQGQGLGLGLGLGLRLGLGRALCLNGCGFAAIALLLACCLHVARAAVTTPFDVVKTRLQTEGVLSARRYNSSAVLPVMRRIVQEEGWSALWRGVRPRVLFNAPSAAICWGTYESIKAFLAR